MRVSWYKPFKDDVVTDFNLIGKLGNMIFEFSCVAVEIFVRVLIRPWKIFGELIFCEMEQGLILILFSQKK